MKKYLQNWFEIFKFNFKSTLFEEVIRGNKWPTPKEEKTQLFKHYQYIRQLDLYKLSVYDAIVTVMFQWFRLLLRWQEGRKEAWFRLLLVSRKKKCRYFPTFPKKTWRTVYMKNMKLAWLDWWHAFSRVTVIR